MHDPGCHWFLVNGKYVKSVARHGPVTLLNQDEAALRIKGPGGTKLERVGAKLTLRARARIASRWCARHPTTTT
jgi:hypothetical protein